MAYVSVSRGQYDAEIYPNDKSELARDLSRDVSQRTATQEPETAAQKIEPVAAHQESPTQEQAQGHGLEMGLG